MSGLLAVAPPLPVQPQLRTGTIDGRYYDLPPDLGPLGTTVAAAPLVTAFTVTRMDGTPTGTGDLTIEASPAPFLDSTSLIVHWWETATVVALYKISIQVATADGRSLIYDCLQQTVSQLG